MNNPRSSKRAYSSPLRAEQAAATRERILDAAGALFGELGYARTTMRAIADAAGVSVETVQLNGPKARLLLAAVERAAAGEEGEQSMLDRPAVREILAEPDRGRLLERTAQFLCWSHARTAALWVAYEHAAASDAAVAESHRALIGRMRDDARRVIAELDARGMLRSGADHAELADTWWLLALPSTYQRLVTQAGWSEERFVAWLAAAMERELLD